MTCSVGETVVELFDVNLFAKGNKKELVVTERKTNDIIGYAKIDHKSGFTVMIVKNVEGNNIYGHSQTLRPFEEEVELAKSIIVENYNKKW